MNTLVKIIEILTTPIVLGNNKPEYKNIKNMVKASKKSFTMCEANYLLAQLNRF